MSSLGRAAGAVRRSLGRARDRATGAPRLVGVVCDSSVATDPRLAAALEQAAPGALLHDRGSGEALRDDDLVVALEPDAVVDVAALRDAVALARRGLVAVGGGPAPPAGLDPRDLVAPATAWAALGVDAATAGAVDVVRLLRQGERSGVRPWWRPGAGDADLPLAEQRRFRVDLAEQRAADLLAGWRELQRGPRDVADAWRRTALADLLPPVYADAVGGGPAHLAALRPLVVALLTDGPTDALTAPVDVPVAARRAAYAVAQGTWDDLALLLDHDGDHPHGLPVADGLVELPDGLGPDAAAVPPAWRRVEDVDRTPHVRLVHACHRDGRLSLRGVAFRDHLEPDERVTVEAEVDDGWVRLPVAPWRHDLVPVTVERSFEEHAEAGFAVDAELGARPTRVRVAGESGWSVEVVPDLLPDPPASAVVVDAAELRDGALRLRLAQAPPDARPRLEGPRGRCHEGRVEQGADGARVVLPLAARLWGDDGPPAAGRYRVEGLELTAAPALLADPPELHDDRVRVVLDLGPAGRLGVRVATPLTARERSAVGQRSLRSAAARAPARPRTVLIEAFHGRSADDSPGPVAQALRRLAPDLDLALVVDDPRVRPGEGVRAVARRSTEWHALLSGAAAYVSNASAPPWFAKRPGQVHLQTWHGTPLKRIGEDRGPGDLQVWRHRRDVAAQAAGWDALVSANPLSSQAFRSAFGYTGPMLESGYPRNDLLVDPAVRDRARARTREVLGVAPDAHVVLYAPTWREHAGRRDAKPLHLDAPRLVAALPGSVVLVRGHYNAAGAADAFDGRSGVLDVTRFPDAAPLFCAADALVTDYSSVLFDFVLLDRPVVLLVPDLERYREVERGFYLDPADRAPGPLARTTDEVVELLRGADTGTAARAAFREEFCPWDDGHAADRVARWLLERLGQA